MTAFVSAQDLSFLLDEGNWHSSVQHGSDCSAILDEESLITDDDDDDDAVCPSSEIFNDEDLSQLANLSSGKSASVSWVLKTVCSW